MAVVVIEYVLAGVAAVAGSDSAALDDDNGM
jgi:hypothetical protein